MSEGRTGSVWARGGGAGTHLAADRVITVGPVQRETPQVLTGLGSGPRHACMHHRKCTQPPRLQDSLNSSRSRHLPSSQTPPWTPAPSRKTSRSEEERRGERDKDNQHGQPPQNPGPSPPTRRQAFSQESLQLSSKQTEEGGSGDRGRRHALPRLGGGFLPRPFKVNAVATAA